jgi:hypothetical protein
MKATTLVPEQARLPAELPGETSKARGLLSVPLLKADVVTAAKAELPVPLEDLPTRQDLLSTISLIPEAVPLPALPKGVAVRGLLAVPTASAKNRVPEGVVLAEPIIPDVIIAEPELAEPGTQEPVLPTPPIRTSRREP